VPDVSNFVILNVNDVETERYFLGRILKNAGFKVEEASTGQEALQKALLKPDLVLLDVKLPDISGFEVCKRLRQNPSTSTIAIVHLSARVVSSREKAQGLYAGADAYLTQPIGSEELIATIQTMVRIKKMEESLRSAVDEHQKILESLKQERSMREDFVAALSHDLRNPLSAAKMNAGMILRSDDPSGKNHIYANRILGNISRADKMITDLLDANRIRAGEPLPLEVAECDLSEVAREALADLTIVHGDRFKLDLVGKSIGYWSCDALKRVLENLVVNGVKYGHSDTPIVVSIRRKDQSVLLSVHNQGEVLSPEEISNLFKPFMRTLSAQASSKEGWGLGLTLVRGLIQAHGGEVYVESSEEKGTIFTATLPQDSRPILEQRKQKIA
jgi:signal transduction histidine kinase